MNKYSSIPALLCCAVLMSACGGGGGDTPVPATPPADPVPPPTVPVTPPTVPVTPPTAPVRLDAPVWGNDGTAVTRANLPTATFAAKLDNSTVTAASVQVVGPEGDPMPGTALISAPDGKVIAWTPAAGKLPGGTDYELRLSTGIKDTAALSMDSAVAKPFAVAPQHWATASNILGNMPYFTGGVSTTLVSDKAGNVTAIWYYSVNWVDQVFASRLDKASGTWSAPQTIQGISSTYIGGLNAVAAPNGDVFAVWTDNQTRPEKVVMARYVAASGTWEKPVPFNGMPAGIDAGGAQMAIDGNGIITVVFKSWVGNALYAARYDPATSSWGFPFQVDVPNPDNYFINVRLLADQVGNVTVGWTQRSASSSGLHVRRYSALTLTWSEVKVIDSNFAPQAFDMASDAHGGITLVWTHGGMIMDDPYIAASVFDPTTSAWSIPAKVSGTGTGNAVGAGYSSVARSRSGISTAVWRQGNGIFSARLMPGSGWTAPYRIGDMDAPEATLALGVDLAGNVIVAYPHGASMMAARYSASAKAWEPAAAIGSPEGETSVFANAASVVVDVNGDVTAAWRGQTEQGGVARYRVLSNRLN